jgi:serine phosphatase RsbU (regulator of sigma subunit)
VRSSLPALWQLLRGRPWFVLLAALAAQVAVLVPLGSLHSPRTILGLPGSWIALLAVVVGALAGPIQGLLSAAVGGLVFFVAVAHLGRVSSLPSTLISACLWALAGLISGLIGDSLRRSSAARRALAVSLAKEEAAGKAFAERARLAQTLTASLLPRLPAHHGGLELFSLYRPGEQRLGLGGDFMDALPLAGGRLALIIGDVAGHGPAAAALGAGLRASWRSLVLSNATPQSLMETLNALVYLEERPEVFVTATLAWIDAPAGQALFLSAGHPKPLLIAGQVRRIEAPTYVPLGVEERVRWRPGRLALPTEWSILCYTDGLIEGRAWPQGSERFGERRLMAAFSNGFSQGLNEAALQKLVTEIETANGSVLPDDVAALLLCRRRS